jgi:hypothetical protein
MTIVVLAPAYAYAVHDDIWTTIEVSIINANISRDYELSVGIPKAHSSLSVSEDHIFGEETQYYNYKFEFEDIPAGTPFEVCVQEGASDYWSPTYLEELCTSGKTKDPNVEHTQIDASAPTIDRDGLINKPCEVNNITTCATLCQDIQVIRT